MGQTIFTTNLLVFNSQLYAAIWLRTTLEEYLQDPKQLKSLKQNSRFNTKINPATLTEEKEALFSLYKTAVSFEPSASLVSLLYGKETTTIYDTYEVLVYDDDKLIACGFFDMGENSAAGISCFYDPAYKKYSLGKFLIYTKMNYCKKMGLQYFYAGYFAPHYAAFDYKLEIGSAALQYYDYKDETWNPIAAFLDSNNPLEVMKRKLNTLHQLLLSHSVESRLFHYEFFNATLMPDFRNANLLDFPLFLYCFDLSDVCVNPIIVFDIKADAYQLLKCATFFNVDAPLTEEGSYCTRILTGGTVVFASADVYKIAAVLMEIELKFTTL